MFKFIIYFIFSLLYRQVKSEISILSGGIEHIEEDDIALIFFITVKNICQDDLELSVNMIQCCETMNSEEVECNSMMLIGGDMGVLSSMDIKNLTLIYPNLYLFNRQGVCTIAVTYRNQLKKKDITTEVHFDTTQSCPGKQQSDECSTKDLDIKANCNPVDCLIKYSGTVSYFNPECKRCQKVPVCNSKVEGTLPDVAYSPYNNECIDLNIPISKKDLEEIDTDRSNNNQTTMINAICHYGKVTESGECLCHDGWTTATNDEGMYDPGVAQHHLCNIQVGDWHCVNKNKIRVTTILITVFAITIISKVLLFMCLMTWCYKHFRKSDKTCAKDTDPDDPSILLCDDSSFEKCLCCAAGESNQEQSDRKLKGLHSQTVNVSYYPSSPSAFSSIKGSTGSSKFTIKTEPTIDLSNTSTSEAISFPEGNTLDESENSDDSDNGEDKSNEIAYGVYCSVDELEEEEEVEEEESEEGEGEEEEDDNTIDNSSREVKEGISE